MKNKKLIVLLFRLMIFIALFMLIPDSEVRAERGQGIKIVSMKKSKVKSKKKKKSKKKTGKKKRLNKNKKKKNKRKKNKRKKNRRKKKDKRNKQDNIGNSSGDQSTSFDNKKIDKEVQKDKENQQNDQAVVEKMPEVFIGGIDNSNLPEHRDNGSVANQPKADRQAVLNNDFTIFSAAYSKKNGLAFGRDRVELPASAIVGFKRTGENDGILHKIKWTGSELDSVLSGKVGSYVLTAEIDDSISINGVDYGKIKFDININIK